MNITRENIDALNAVVKVDIAKEDYSDKVEKILIDYRKSANIPGFRKGHVPMTLVKKQYGKAVLVDEVNKLLQDALNKYLTEEKLDVLGNPLPKPQDNLDWAVDIRASDAYNALSVYVTGSGSHTVRWTALVKTIEVGQ